MILALVNCSGFSQRSGQSALPDRVISDAKTAAETLGTGFEK